ncbi:hypothetical protein V6N13_053599 [Hibiscus sabdariffa]
MGCTFFRGSALEATFSLRAASTPIPRIESVFFDDFSSGMKLSFQQQPLQDAQNGALPPSRHIALYATRRTSAQHKAFFIAPSLLDSFLSSTKENIDRYIFEGVERRWNLSRSTSRGSIAQVEKESLRFLRNKKNRNSYLTERYLSTVEGTQRRVERVLRGLLTKTFDSDALESID